MYFRRELVWDFIHLNNLTRMEFANLCGISYQTLNKLFKNELNNIKINDIHKISNALNLRMFFLIED